MILISGSTGFLGQSLINTLTLASSPPQIVAALRSDKPTSFSSAVKPIVVGDIHASTNWSAFLHKVTSVVHTAARVHVMQDTATNPFNEFRKTNTDGTLNFARQAAAAGVKRFVFISSVKVNGEATVPNQAFKSSDVSVPLDPYGISKYEAEQGLRAIANETGMEVVIIRPPLVYGPGVKANFASMMHTLQRGLPLPLASVTSNRRSLVALDNLVDLIITCISHPAAANQTFMVSDGEDLSTADLLRRMGAAMGKPARLFPVPPALLQFGANALGKGDVAQRLLGNLQVDITHTREVLGWSPPVGVDEGLRRAAQGLLK